VDAGAVAADGEPGLAQLAREVGVEVGQRQPAAVRALPDAADVADALVTLVLQGHVRTAGVVRWEATWAMTDTAARVIYARQVLAAFCDDHGALCAYRGQRARGDHPLPADLAASVDAQIADTRVEIVRAVAVLRENIPACDLPDGCGAAAGTACAVGCPSRAGDEHDALFATA